MQPVIIRTRRKSWLRQMRRNHVHERLGDTTASERPHAPCLNRRRVLQERVVVGHASERINALAELFCQRVRDWRAVLFRIGLNAWILRRVLLEQRYTERRYLVR